MISGIKNINQKNKKMKSLVNYPKKNKKILRKKLKIQTKIHQCLNLIKI